MRREWHQYREPGYGLTQPAVNTPEVATLGLDHWRGLPREQTPPWPDLDEVAQVCNVLTTGPSIVAPYEVDGLRERLADRSLSIRPHQ